MSFKITALVAAFFVCQISGQQYPYPNCQGPYNRLDLSQAEAVNTAINFQMAVTAQPLSVIADPLRATYKARPDALLPAHMDRTGELSRTGTRFWYNYICGQQILASTPDYGAGVGLGTTGSAGWSGTTGSAGWPGTTGSAGWPGTTGSTGLPGTTGSAGWPGTSQQIGGTNPAAALNGLTGAAGSNPAAALSGLTGAAGSNPAAALAGAANPASALAGAANPASALAGAANPAGAAGAAGAALDAASAVPGFGSVTAALPI